MASTRGAAGMIGRGTALADEFAQIRHGVDLALFRALNLLLLEAGDRAPGTAVDRAFTEEHADGFEEFAADRP
ncbi:hypothetical protein RKE30_32390 [Streptomyces sp. Li-HN-5-11]|nr:hypothetical protein [Streptomyces sp. Li-HN-5-11]WNM34739.1 hypothetical protein RKE30_32390 [Streptomyces sp. Li-HN-5-11]